MQYSIQPQGTEEKKKEHFIALSPFTLPDISLI